MRRVSVHIEELILSGFAPGERYRIQDEVQRALAELVASGALSLPASMPSRGMEALPPQGFKLASRSAAELGTRIAGVLVSGISETLAPDTGKAT